MAQRGLFEQPRRALSLIERELKRAEAEIIAKGNELHICEQRIANYDRRDLGYSQANKALQAAQMAHLASLEKFEYLRLEFRHECGKQIKELGLTSLDRQCEIYQNHVNAKLAGLENIPFSDKLLLSSNERKLFEQKRTNFRSKLKQVKELRELIGVISPSSVFPQKRFALINAWLHKNAAFISKRSTGDGRSVAGLILIKELQSTVELHLRREGAPEQRQVALQQQPALGPRPRAEGELAPQRAEGEPEEHPRAEGEPDKRRPQPQ